MNNIENKPLVYQGVKVIVEGKEAIVESSWGQGAHRAFKLNDGRVILDLDKLVANKQAQICVEKEVVVEKKVQFPAPAVDKKWSV